MNYPLGPLFTFLRLCWLFINLNRLCDYTGVFVPFSSSKAGPPPRSIYCSATYEMDLHRSITMKHPIQNDARRAPLSGRPCLKQYETESDLLGLVDKETFSRMHNEKWAGAPWLDEVIGGGGSGVIVLDTAPASCPTSSLSSTASSSGQISRRTTADET